MQLCTIYKSIKKPDSYLYILKSEDFSDVPDALLDMFGKPQLVMTMNLDSVNKLALADINKVKTELLEKGYYLQVPPPAENLLDEFRKQNGIED